MTQEKKRKKLPYLFEKSPAMSKKQILKNFQYFLLKFLILKNLSFVAFSHPIKLFIN